METQVQTTIEYITLRFTRAEAAHALVDPRDAQTALRAALDTAPADVAPPATQRLTLRRPRSHFRGNGNGNGKAHAHAPRSGMEHSDPKAHRAHKSGYKLNLQPCPECGMKRHPKSSTCSRNQENISSRSNGSPDTADAAES